jgi:hypothetical protein
LTNNLFDRVWLLLDDFAGSYSLTVRNCLFFGGKQTIYNDNSQGPATWTFRDNLFDGASIDQQYPVDCNYDAFTTGTIGFTNVGANDVFITNADYQVGPLGNFYYPTNGANLATLIDKGSTWSSNVMMFHYCTTTNQTKEAATKVDIGFHWMALDASASPVDSDGGGVADYLEDVSGNGIVDPGETDWTPGHGLDDANNGLQPPGYLRCEYRVDRGA